MRIVLTRREPIDEPDGVNIFLVSLAQALSDLNHEVKIVVGCLRNQAEYCRRLGPRRDLPILALSNRRLEGDAAVVAWLRAKREIDRFAPDLILHQEAVPLPFRSNTVAVVHARQRRDGLLAPLWRTIRRSALRHCSHIVGTKSELCDQLSRELGSSTASGTPIVGSEQLSPDFLLDGVNGMVAATQPTAMAAALKSVLNDDSLWLRLSAGAARLAERFDGAPIATRYLALAAKVLSAVPTSYPAFE